MEMIEVFKEKISTSLKETQENTIEQVEDMNKIVQELKMEIQEIKVEAWRWKTRKKKETTDTTMTKRIQEMEERI